MTVSVCLDSVLRSRLHDANQVHRWLIASCRPSFKLQAILYRSAIDLFINKSHTGCLVASCLVSEFYNETVQLQAEKMLSYWNHMERSRRRLQALAIAVSASESRTSITLHASLSSNSDADTYRRQTVSN